MRGDPRIGIDSPLMENRRRPRAIRAYWVLHPGQSRSVRVAGTASPAARESLACTSAARSSVLWPNPGRAGIGQ